MKTNQEIQNNIEQFGHKYIVYGDGLSYSIGYADTFGECRALHRQWLERTNHPKKELYAGLACDGHYLKNGMAFPAFYAEE